MCIYTTYVCVCKYAHICVFICLFIYIHLFIQLPPEDLSVKDRSAVIAKQLSDFLYQYNRETAALLSESNNEGLSIDEQLFDAFLLMSRYILELKYKSKNLFVLLRTSSYFHFMIVTIFFYFH